ncbi:MAG TPA: gliding motility-associated C-terminal domain-containing protein, partial [Cytophagaceae bacterium]|nr:gliding motility-associated C-terminal domain-containing protein [Cytophagaceae bacterium]
FGDSSIFDGSNSAAHQYFWSQGTPDTTSGIISTTVSSSLVFQHNGGGGNLPEGAYNVYLITKQGFCLDTATVHFTVTFSTPTNLCINSIQANIQAAKEVMVDDATPVSLALSGTASSFDGSNPAPHQYFWSLGNPDTTTKVFSTNSGPSLTFAYQGAGGNLPEGAYTVFLIIKQGYCLDTVSVNVNATHFFIPNLVTPNGDQKNDKFEISNTSGRYDIEVYNRWGERVYQEKGYTNGWDLGNVSDGVYYFSILDGESAKNYKGWVQVLH